MYKNDSLSLEDLNFEECFVTLANNNSTVISNERLVCTDWAFDAIDGRKVESLVTKVRRNFLFLISSSKNSL